MVKLLECVDPITCPSSSRLPPNLFISRLTPSEFLLYQVLRSPTCKLSVNKLYLDFKSRGLRIAKDDLDAYSTRMPPDYGALLENLVFLTLRRKGHEVGYYETKQGHEVDFVYREGEATVLNKAHLKIELEPTADHVLLVRKKMLPTEKPKR